MRRACYISSLHKLSHTRILWHARVCIFPSSTVLAFVFGRVKRNRRSVVKKRAGAPKELANWRNLSERKEPREESFFREDKEIENQTFSSIVCLEQFDPLQYRLTLWNSRQSFTITYSNRIPRHSRISKIFKTSFRPLIINAFLHKLLQRLNPPFGVRVRARCSRFEQFHSWLLQTITVAMFHIPQPS